MALNDPSIWELASLLGLDCLWLDLEHHAHSLETANQLMRAARVGTSDVVARPAKGEWMRMMRLLEAGAQGILYPRCEGADEAREVVRMCKFAPLGERGFDGGNPDMPYSSMDIADYVEMANRETFIIAQLENEQSVLQAEQILEVPGIDGVMLGPADFTVLSGIPGQFEHPRVQEAIDHIAQAAYNTGKHWGTVASDNRKVEQLKNMAATLFFSGADILAVKAALEKLRDDLIPFGFIFDGQLDSGKSYLQLQR
jgi:4-hydroxy-2-oxoheptanedioate aldolase